jgi:hypothetical protein
MNRLPTVTAKALPINLERSSGSRMTCPVQIRVVRWQEVKFVPSVKHMCATVAALNQSKTFAANFS